MRVYISCSVKTSPTLCDKSSPTFIKLEALPVRIAFLIPFTCAWCIIFKTPLIAPYYPGILNNVIDD